MSMSINLNPLNLNHNHKPNHYDEQIHQAAVMLGLALNEDQRNKLSQYAHLLYQWNSAYNLSALKTMPDILIKHVFDCLAVVQPIKMRLNTLMLNNNNDNNHNEPHSVLDVGTGAGLPGIILAIALPNTSITMVDCIHKKISFVQYAIKQLKLNNAHAHHSRIEDWNKHRYTIITARAWTALDAIPRLTGHCLKDNGVIAALKGPKLLLEAETLSTPWYLDEVIELNVPYLNEARSLGFVKQRLYI